MGDIKPLGSEKLKGQDKINRILQLTYFDNQPKTENVNKPEIIGESTTGGVFGIVKEKDGYYVKRGLTENTLDYIGGLFMKNKNRFSSYAEALKRCEYIRGQEVLQEGTKYVLKTNKPKVESPMPEPSMPEPSMPEPSMNTPAPPTQMPADDGMGEPSGENMNGEPKKSDYMREIQKLAGKLGQELRDESDKLESNDIKYVLNMILSAVDLDNLETDDKDEIAKRFDSDDDEYNDEESNDTSSKPDNNPMSDKELGETMSMLDKFIHSSVHDDDDKEEDLDEEIELDLDELQNHINNTVKSTLQSYFNK